MVKLYLAVVLVSLSNIQMVKMLHFGSHSSSGGIIKAALKLFNKPLPGIGDLVHSSSTTPGVIIFLTVLSSALVTDKTFKDVCDLSPATPEDFQNFFYDFTYKAAKDLGFDDLTAGSFAKTASGSLNCVDPLTTKKVFLIYFKSLAEFMSSVGVLNIKNAIPLALECLKLIDTRAKKMVKEDCPQTKMETLSGGYVAFCQKRGIYSPKTAPSIVYYFGEVAKLAKKF
ncbi:hypothetical protein CDAR_464741 [Caerostris darwini]|uniref:Uncharacterized protein n=1 Tax=Caerostris darwini TaxID=1538125 RepID=A0AAV4RGE9_9ARAC|nr:hypothetical protein CDAR_464741 [Caerostris darwini]